jgi:hypothetical protein
MVAAAEVARETLSIQGPEGQPRKRNRRGWAPDDTDKLVYQWVKFDGTRQVEVALRLGIDQSTVSRIVQRYEKWQAHATPATDGRLSHEERRRAQRWLTYERNERIVASSLRLADELARSVDSSRTVITRSDSSDDRQVRTELSVLDRTAMAARFLRLAQKVSMDNHRLTEMEPLPELAPLAEEEVAEQVAEATEVTREVEAVREAAERMFDENAAMRARVDAEVAAAVEAAVAKRMKEMDLERLAVVGSEADGGEDHGVAVVGAAAHGEAALIDRGLLRDPQPPEPQPVGEPNEAGASGSFRPRQEPGTEAESLTIRQTNEAAVVEVQVHNVHKMHTCITPKTSASVDAVVSCERETPRVNFEEEACIVPGAPTSSSRGSLRDPQPPLHKP